MTGLSRDLASLLEAQPMLVLMVKVTALFAIGLAVAALLSRGRAAARHIVLLATFVAVVALAVASAWSKPVAFEVPIAATSQLAIQARADNSIAAPSMQSSRAPAVDRSMSANRSAAESSNSQSQPPAATQAAVNTTSTEPTASTLSLPSFTPLLALVWLLGSAVALIVLLVDLRALRTIRRHSVPLLSLQPFARELAEKAGVRPLIDLVSHEHVAGPLTCGFRRPVIIVPPDAESWRPEELRRTLIHEIEHISRLDWSTQIASYLVCAALWFHPLAWLARRAMALAAESACDDAVVLHAGALHGVALPAEASDSTECCEYAEQLVGLARRAVDGKTVALGMAKRSDLSVRITAIMDESQRRGRVGIVRGTFSVVALLAVAIACAPLHISTHPQPPPANSEPVDNTSREPSEVGGDGTALIVAARSGHLDVATELLRSGADPNRAVTLEGSPLIVSARAGNQAITELLIAYGADVNLAVVHDGSPLIAASQAGHAKLVELLIARGADIDASVPGDENPLIVASAAGHLDVVRLLIHLGAEVNARAWAGDRGGEWRTPLKMAMRNNHTTVAEFLAAVGAE